MTRDEIDLSIQRYTLQLHSLEWELSQTRDLIRDLRLTFVIGDYVRDGLDREGTVEAVSGNNLGIRHNDGGFATVRREGCILIDPASLETT